MSCNAVISASTSCKVRFMCFLCSICETIYIAVNNLPEVVLFLINTHQINTLTWADVNHVLPVEICGMTIIQDLKIQHNAVTTFLHQGGGHGSRTDDSANISRKDPPVKAPNRIQTSQGQSYDSQLSSDMCNHCNVLDTHKSLE